MHIKKTCIGITYYLYIYHPFKGYKLYKRQYLSTYIVHFISNYLYKGKKDKLSTFMTLCSLFVPTQKKDSPKRALYILRVVFPSG